MVCERKKLSSVLDSAPQNSINLAKVFKKVFNNCKNAGLCYYKIRSKRQKTTTKRENNPLKA
jgi:hypothetical protein